MKDFRNEPIVRHEALAPFSRDHYTGLVQSQHLVKASRADAAARREAVADFVDAFDHEIAEHFRDEERILGAVLSDPDREALLQQHRRLEQDAEGIRRLRRSTDPDPQTLAEAGKRLEEHIRWEERELFDRVQKQLDEQQIAQLQQQTAVIETNRSRNINRQSAKTDT